MAKLNTTNYPMMTSISHYTPNKNACLAVDAPSECSTGVMGLCNVALNVPFNTVLAIKGLNS